MNSMAPRPPGATRRLAALGALALAFVSLGCPGDLDPLVRANKMASPDGGSGGSGGGGTGGGGTFCNAPEALFATQCAISGCHVAAGTNNADLDLTAAGIVGRLLGKMPTGVNGSMCGTVTKPYLVQGSDPAEGLLLDKLFLETQPCGFRMPIGLYFDPQEEQCTREWARGVTTGAITQ